MSKDKVEGFLWGLGAAVLVSCFLKPAADRRSGAPAEKDLASRTGRPPGVEIFRRPIQAEHRNIAAR